MRRSRRSWLFLGALAAAVFTGAITTAVVSSTTEAPPRANAPSRPTTRITGHPAARTTASPRLTPHVMVIVMENHGYRQLIDNPTAPYLSALVRNYGLATASYAIAHPSLPNYLDLVSGSPQGVTDDCTTCTANAPQVVDQLQRAGIAWDAYMEAAPSPCFTGNATRFDRHHDPFIYAPHIVDDPAECDRVVPFAGFAPALARNTLPPFVWITPDVDHDMHTGTVAEGDAWLHATLPRVLGSPWYRDGGVVIITFDESTGGTDAGCCAGAVGGHIMTLVVSQRTHHGARMSTPIDDAGVLRTVEALYHLPYLGAAANSRSGTLLPLLGMPRARGA